MIIGAGRNGPRVHGNGLPGKQNDFVTAALGVFPIPGSRLTPLAKQLQLRKSGSTRGDTTLATMRMSIPRSRAMENEFS